MRYVTAGEFRTNSIRGYGPGRQIEKYLLVLTVPQVIFASYPLALSPLLRFRPGSTEISAALILW